MVIKVIKCPRKDICITETKKLARLNVCSHLSKCFLSNTIKGLDNMFACGQDLICLKKLGIIYFTFLFVLYMFSILLNHFLKKKKQ